MYLNWKEQFTSQCFLLGNNWNACRFPRTNNTGQNATLFINLVSQFVPCGRQNIIVKERFIENQSQRCWCPYSFAITLSIQHLIYIDTLKRKMCLLPNSYESSNSCLSCFDRYYCGGMSLGAHTKQFKSLECNLVTTAETLQLALVSLSSTLQLMKQ